MTPVSLGLTLLGLVALFWPLATLLFKRHVLNAQWLMMLALSLVALSFFLLGSMFNTFLTGEFLLLMLFFDVILISPAIIHMALTVLTQPNASTSKVRLLLLISLATIALMIVISIIGGADMYRLWTIRGAEGLAWNFIPGNWHYNIIVITNSYIFWTVFFFEAFFIFVTSIRQFIRFKRINAEYYTDDRFRNINLKGIYIASNVGLFIMTISQFVNLFSHENRHLFYFGYCLPLAVCLFYLGHSVYKINSSAESLQGRPRSRKDSALLVRQLEEYVEKGRAFLNPDISVFMLAEHFHTSEDDIIDAIHRYQGISFGEYIDGLRVQHAVSIILAEHPDTEDPDVLIHLAHQSGYLTADAFRNAFSRIMQTPVSDFSQAKFV